MDMFHGGITNSNTRKKVYTAIQSTPIEFICSLSKYTNKWHLELITKNDFSSIYGWIIKLDHIDNETDRCNIYNSLCDMINNEFSFETLTSKTHPKSCHYIVDYHSGDNMFIIIDHKLSKYKSQSCCC